MKKLLFILLITTFLATSSTTTSYAQSSETEYKASMPGWEVNLDSAYIKSIKTGKPILANFTGTDWCGWCIRLKNEVFLTPQFKEWAKNNVILLELDFPRRFQLPENIVKQNRELSQAFGVQGYPTLWVFDISVDQTTHQSSLKGLASIGYVAGGPSSWIKDLELKLKK